MDEDHLDIYGNKANLIEAFEEFAERTREEGKILLKAAGLFFVACLPVPSFTGGIRCRLYTGRINRSVLPASPHGSPD